MSHLIDFNGITEKLVLLQHFAFGSENYCSLRLAGSEEDAGNEEFDSYWSWVKGIVSNYTIECAIKFRILQDTIQGKDDIIRFEDLDSKSCSDLSIGEIRLGNFELSLRESCNKIIHAQKAIPKWGIESSNETEFKYWLGLITLSGNKNKESWELILDIAQWSRAMETFMDLFEASDAFHYVGQDWY